MAFAKPFTARCNHPDCRVTRDFYTEGASKQYGDDHLMIFGDGHKVFYGKKANP